MIGKQKNIGERNMTSFEELVEWLKTLRCDMYAEKMKQKGITSLSILRAMNNEELKKKLNEVFRGCDLSDKRRLMIALEKTKTKTITPIANDSSSENEEIQKCEEELMQTIDDKFEQKEKLLDEQLRQIAEIESQIKKTMEDAQMLCDDGYDDDAKQILHQSLKSTQETITEMRKTIKFVDADIDFHL
ncbi:hypothetical protein RFI_37907 [Reticulomyxa filosa]|uniref:SAM domain-containing protein n=1 Tax=Reticulomyxa filosa TaxID=46433 RepID=X6LDD2_RETFI|nr:hypothetical protein RFI_37907 [Reticulomyxa filosa]|eukprot:ETN99563.1 hypothetical protein RFI_37907 [Reticulomyxa filosa]